MSEYKWIQTKWKKKWNEITLVKKSLRTPMYKVNENNPVNFFLFLGFVRIHHVLLL